MNVAWALFFVGLIQLYRQTECQTTDNSVTACGSQICRGKARCTEGNRCACLAGYHGDNCADDTNECDNGDSLCFYRGHCINTAGSYICSCLPGWVDSGHCELPVSVIDNNRTCVDGHYGNWCNITCFNDSMCGPSEECVNGQVCQCKSPGWRGRSPHCIDVDECKPPGTKCNTGTCVNTPGSFHCVCSPGWSGPSCSADVDECTSTPAICDHGGNCTNVPGSYACSCRTGWKGENCTDDIDECLTGDLCELDVDQCQQERCNSSFHCLNTPGSFKCTVIASINGKDSGVRVGVIVGAVLGSVLGLASIITTTLLLRYWWRRRENRRKTHESISK